MPKRDARLYVTDIADALRKIETYTIGLDYERFSHDEKTIDAVLRNLEVIGEAVKNMPDEMREKHPEIAWKAAAGMRDRLIHEYFGVSVRMVWETVKHDLPAFGSGVEKVLKEMS